MNEMCSDHGQRLPAAAKRVRCPRCGRRVMAATRDTHDGETIKYMPPHKVKGWYKKTKPKKKEQRLKR